MCQSERAAPSARLPPRPASSSAAAAASPASPDEPALRDWLPLAQLILVDGQQAAGKHAGIVPAAAAIAARLHAVAPVAMAALRAAVEPLFARFSVDVVLTGHHHSFQRTCPVLYGACVNSSATHAPVYLITGGAGAGLSALAPTQPDYIAFAADEHSYLAVRADRAAMVLTAKRTVDGSVLDETVLTKA